jgi:lipoprotein-anchoring transpeptidase ErfK/SrfK
MQAVKTKKKAKKKRQIILIVVTSFLLLLGIIYLMVSFYFNAHFFYKTEINGLKVGGMTESEAVEKIGKDVGEYLLTIYDRDGKKYHLTGGDIGCEYVPDGSIEKALEDQSPINWMVAAINGNIIDVDTPMTYDKKMMEKAVANLECFDKENIINPEDADIVFSEDGYEIIPEVLGNKLIKKRVVKLVAAAVTEGAGQLTLTDKEYVKPKVLSDGKKITAIAKNLDSYLNSEVKYEIKGHEEAFGRDDIIDMMTVDENFNVTLNEQVVVDYVQQLATKYNTYADIRSFKTNAGDTVEIGGGDYGWVINKAKETEQLLENVKSGKSITREPIYEQTTTVERDQDIGNTYVEIDYTAQHLWYYKDGQVVLDTPIVSGNISANNGSPDGIFKIAYKESPSVLVGEDYESDVEVFMPFAYNVGIHDASWRTEFGGNTYKTSGSHGCINAPAQKAKELYGMLAIGTPVVAYYREKVVLTAENCRISNAFSYVGPDEERTEE